MEKEVIREGGEGSREEEERGMERNITIGCYSFWQIGADHQGREEGRIKISQSHSS